jgi:enoyl-CoA hydratase/carnithine racemase
MPQDLLVSRPEPSIAVLTLHRPDRKNALSIALRDAISDTLDELAGDDEVRVVVIAGEGTAFSAGFDLGEFDRAFEDESFAEILWASSDRYHQRVLQFPLPTIAAVNGPAIGGGFDLAIMCDLRVGSTAARFAHPEYAFADVVYGPLHDLVGGAVARELCMTGRSVDAEEALALRLLSSIVRPDALGDHALELARTIAVAPRANLARTKAKALRHARMDPGQATLDL